MQTNRTESGRRVEGPQQQEQCRHGEGNIREGEKLRKPGRRTEWGKERQAWDGLQAREQKVCVCVGGGENGEQGQAGLRDPGGELDRGRE